ncbi:MAG: helix-turn-helix transcriptional regulator [Bacteroidetes bacterium]|nr:helix-turn-helix transcriptional regulator [Bacteroidota bacterium]
MDKHHIILLSIGNKLTQLRKKKGYKSYESFAVENNLSRMQYWRIEKGKTNITIKSLARILEIHGITMEEFFRRDKF